MSGSSLKIDYNPLGKRKASRRRRGRSLPRRALSVGLWMVVLLVLPFVVLVRLSISAYGHTRAGPWGSVILGALAATVLLLLYLWVARILIQDRWTLPKVVWVPVIGVVATYLVYALVYLSGVNAKSADIRSHYTALHPLLRVATSTVFLVDREAVITDIGRTRQDYLDWGLDVNEASLHFEQPDGFVYALDLRTRDRPEWQNRLVARYYWAMGLKTLRHTGTADHLHISLRPKRRP